MLLFIPFFPEPKAAIFPVVPWYQRDKGQRSMLRVRMKKKGPTAGPLTFRFARKRLQP